MNPVWEIAAIIVSAALGLAATIIGALILSRLDAMDKRISDLEEKNEKIAAHKTECQREFVSAEQWVRSEAYTRQKLDDISMAMNTLTGSLKIVEQMPQILSSIAREIVKEMKASS